MDIQRGDQVYYRGEVWTVLHIADPMYGPDRLTLDRVGAKDGDMVETAEPQDVQRVEQVR